MSGSGGASKNLRRIQCDALTGLNVSVIWIIKLVAERGEVAAQSVVKDIEILTLQLRRLLTPDPGELPPTEGHRLHTLTLCGILHSAKDHA